MDRRSHFATDSVAHVSMKNRVSDKPLSEGTIQRVRRTVAGIHPALGTIALDRQAKFGDAICVLELGGGMAFARAERMGYVGYIDQDMLGIWSEPTHRVNVRSSFIYDKPSYQAPNPTPISFGSQVSIVSVEGRYARTDDGRFCMVNHLASLKKPAKDPVAEAEKLLHTPYMWGGNSAFGIDCSGLVEIACAACNIPCPGDSDLQMAKLGTTMEMGTPYKRGDLLFWRGHVAWVANEKTLLHANAGHMSVVFEPIDAAIDRIQNKGDGPVLRHARLSV